jgi:hypothetical protein
VNYLRLPGVFQFLERSLKRPAGGPDGRIIEKTYRNKPKNKQQPHATPLRGYPTVFYGGKLGRELGGMCIGWLARLRACWPRQYSYCWAGLLAKLTDAGA